MSSEKLAGALREIRDIMKIDGGFPNTVPAINEVLAAYESADTIEVDEGRLLTLVIGAVVFPMDGELTDDEIRKRADDKIAYLQRREEK